MSTSPDPSTNRLARDLAGQAPPKPDEPLPPRYTSGAPTKRPLWIPALAAAAVVTLILGGIWLATRNKTQPAAIAPTISQRDRDTKAALAAYKQYQAAQTQAYKQYKPQLIQPYLEDEAYDDAVSFISALKENKQRLVGNFQVRVMETSWTTIADTASVEITGCKNSGSVKLLDPKGRNMAVGRNGKPLPAHQKTRETMRSVHGGPWRAVGDEQVLASKC